MVPLLDFDARVCRTAPSAVLFQLEEEVKLALDMDVMEQEEALEGAGTGRRGSRKNRIKARINCPSNDNNSGRQK